jgi:hypothetical protein
MTTYSGKLIRKTPLVPTQQSASGVWTTEDAAVAVRNNTWPVAGVPDPISRSVRLRSSATAYLTRTLPVAGNQKTWTWSAWVKRGNFVGSSQVLFSSDFGESNATWLEFGFDSGDYFYITTYSTDYYGTSSVFRDPSAWYHIVIKFDTTQAVAANRCLMYVNNVSQTLSGAGFTFNANFGINAAQAHDIGRRNWAGNLVRYFDGYLTEINFIDGQALTSSSFGTTDASTGAWIPMAYTGTYGTNGFYLNFKDNTSTTTLGYDYSGNNNNWTANNISLTSGVTYDSMLDVPTSWVGYSATTDKTAVTRGNYATLNPLATRTSLTTVSAGNLNMISVDSLNAYTVPATILMQSGKWYFEAVATGSVSIAYPAFGIQVANTPFATTNGIPGAFAGYNGFSFFPNGYFSKDNAATSVPFSYTTNDVIAYCVDIDAGKAWVSKNGVWLQSGDPATGANPNYTFTAGTAMYMCVGNLFTSGPCSINFGQRPFSYTPPTDFKALCVTNLPTPTILIGAQHFAASTYTGNGSTQSIINSGNNTTATTFQPDLVWGKSRSITNSNWLMDSVRGTGVYLSSDQTSAEITNSTFLTAYNSNGFTVGASTSANQNAATYVGWQWKGGGTAVSNTAGTITSSVSANTTAGFSIATYTGNGTSGATVGHGLSVAPSMVILKRRNVLSNWQVKHASLNANQNLELNSTAAVDTAPGSGYISAVGATTLTLLNGGSAITNVNTNGSTYVAYCFAAVAGYSAFGSYTGNGSADGPFVYLGFRPRWVLIRNTAVSNWVLIDTSTSPYNVTPNFLNPNTSGAEVAFSSLDITSNGFKLRNTDSGFNTSSGTYIYAAFAENPFKYSNAR